MAHAVPSQALALWIGTVGTIPANWSRDTDYDDLYIQGVTDDNRGTGGAAHTHTTTHGLVGNVHTHTFIGDSQTPDDMVRTEGVIGVRRSDVVHSHLSATSNPATITYVDDTDPTDAASADPPFVRAIVIKPDDAAQLIPNGTFCFTAKSTAPTGFDITGSGGTVDYDGKFVLGAVTDGNGGATGGTATHSHTKDDSVHVVNGHLHASKACGLSSSHVNVKPAFANEAKVRAHHNVILNTKALSDLSAEAMTVDAASSEPAYFKLLGIENTTVGDPILPEGVILMYEGTIASIPDQWSHYARLGARQLKITKTPAEVGETGGANEHVHNVQAHGPHTHTGTHDHSTTETDFSDEISQLGAPTVSVPSTVKEHSHVWTVGTTTPTTQATAAFDTGSTDKREAYREVIFVEYAPYSVHIKGDTTIQGGAIAA